MHQSDYLLYSVVFKGSFISETFGNFDDLNHHWPKIQANLNSFCNAKERIQIGWDFRPVVVQVIKIVKGFWDKATFTYNDV